MNILCTFHVFMLHYNETNTNNLLTIDETTSKHSSNLKLLLLLLLLLLLQIQLLSIKKEVR